MLLTPEDLAPFATIDDRKADAMIADAEAQAALVAPCLTDPAITLSDALRAAVKAILRRAVLRWNEVGTGAVTQQTAGSFGQSIDTTNAAPKSLFWPSEITSLQGICREAGVVTTGGKAFAIDTAPTWYGAHSEVCSLYFGALRCSCGANINRYEGPLYEGGILS